MFHGREEELSRLEDLWKKSSASLVTCRGRFRIGKSALIAEFASRSHAAFLSFTGHPPHPGMSKEFQLRVFSERFARLFGGPLPVFRNWAEAFHHLASKISDDRRTVILLDEVPWMGGRAPDFPGDIKAAWDREFKRHPHLVLVLCGSVPGWIEENLLLEPDFAGCRSLDLEIGELPLSDCLKFWGRAALRSTHEDFLDVLSVTGGVPRYLKEVDPTAPADEIVRQSCFLPSGMLHDDLHRILAEAFGRSATTKLGLLSALADGPKCAEEIARTTGGSSNGHLSRALAELEESGLIAAAVGLNPVTGQPTGIVRYRIRDNYTRFFLRHIEPNLAMIEAGRFRFRSLRQFPRWETMLERQFKTLVLNHIAEFLPALGLDGSLILSADPWLQTPAARRAGCQIDLLVMTRRSVMIVEIKRRQEIGREVTDEVLRKAVLLKTKRGTPVRTALVYAGRLSPDVNLDGYFDAIVPVESVLRR